MEYWVVFFLGLIALGSLVQTGFLVGLMLFGRDLARRLDALQARLDREVTPALQDLTRVTNAAAEVSDLATLQARRIDQLLADTIEKIEDTTGAIQQFVVRPLRPIGGIMALLKGLQKGLEVYLHLDRAHKATSAPTPPRARSNEDDEHLFI